jgi:hypothetical protein
MGEVGRELFASDLERDLIQRAAARATMEFRACWVAQTLVCDLLFQSRIKTQTKVCAPQKDLIGSD